MYFLVTSMNDKKKKKEKKEIDFTGPCEPTCLQNEIDLHALERECRAVGLDLVVAAHAAENLVHNAKAGIFGRHWASNLSHDLFWVCACDEMNRDLCVCVCVYVCVCVGVGVFVCVCVQMFFSNRQQQQVNWIRK